MAMLKFILCLPCLLFIAILCGCKSSHTNIATIKETDTLHVYHTDTIREIHADTISIIVETVVHDSIVVTRKETYFISSEKGDTIRLEKETDKESWHSNDTNSQFIRHTRDSILHAKMDSAYNASHHEIPVVVEVQKHTPWYKKAWSDIARNLAGIGVAVMLALAIYRLGVRVKK